MPTNLSSLALKLVALGAAACTTVYAAPGRPPSTAPRPRPPDPSPYVVQLVGDDGATIETYQRQGRYYVLGDAGRRYSVRVTNPTGRRVEAVISIDGIDVIDGGDADFVRKRGYVVEAYDTLEVDGFRTSDSSVAAFRFSSVGASYAGRTGRARNVGVVGVAIFEERGQPVAVVPRPTPTPHRRYDERGREEGAPADAGRATASAAPARPSAPRANAGAALDGGSALRDLELDDGGMSAQGRPGLGTEFGEQRWSAVSFTRFVRRHAARPDATAELRYNDRAGLTALGIALDPGGDDLALRETADPFPATRYAQPPR